MTEYKLDPRFFSTLRRRILLIGIPFILFFLSLGAYLAAGSLPGPMPWFMWAAVLLLTLIASGIGVLGGLQRGLHSWGTFRIVLDEDGITQVRDSTRVRILYSEITRIDAARGALAIRTANRYRFIVVPHTLESFDAFRLRLSERHAIQGIPPAKAARNVAFYIAAWVVMFALIVVFFVATNRYLIIVASVAVLLLPIYMLIVRRKGLSSSLSPFLFWFSVIITAAMAIGRLALAISGH